MNTALPYVDVIFEQLAKPSSDYHRIYQLNIHWGYWDSAATADGSIEDFQAASRAMTRRVCECSAITDQMSVLDVGCGFGGTLFELNESFANMTLAGLNIDGRQLERARQLVRPAKGNTVRFVEGDAVRLPFPDASFDRVLAVECIFDFSSRAAFMKEARRVLRPGGRLIVSDILVHGPKLPALALLRLRELGKHSKLKKFFGRPKVIPRAGYRLLTHWTGFARMSHVDISRHVGPSLDFMIVLAERTESGVIAREDVLSARTSLKTLYDQGILRYGILTFTKPT